MTSSTSTRCFSHVVTRRRLTPRVASPTEKGACQRETPVTLAISDEEKARAEAVIDAFVERVDVAKIVHDVHTDQKEQ